MKKYTVLLMLLCLMATGLSAQFPIKIPKISKPKIENPKVNEPRGNSNDDAIRNPPQNILGNNSNRAVSDNSYNRQMVMDDASTYFDAESVNRSASNSLKDQDVGWYMKSHLRLLGTFSARSSFRVGVKKNGKELSSVRCEGQIKTKAIDDKGRTNVVRERYSLDYDDYMITDLRCFKADAVNKEIGIMDVAVYFINGDTDEEKLVRTYKIDVHRATNVRGSAVKPEQDVPSYYIQRHAEEAVAFAYFNYGVTRGDYFKDPVDRSFGNRDVRSLYIYTTYSPKIGKYLPNGLFTRCTVNGQRIDFTNNNNRDSVSHTSSGRNAEIGSYTDRLIPQYQRGSPYVDKVLFQDMVFQMPIYTGGDESTSNYLKMEDHPGNWECNIISNGETLRTFRWAVANGKIVQHVEQASGNVNLFYDAAMIDMEIPTAGSPVDFRLVPMPNGGLFYGIPWKTAEGKAMAARVPKVGNPYHVPSTKAK